MHHTTTTHSGGGEGAWGCEDARAVWRERLARFYLARDRPEQLHRIDEILKAYGADFLALHRDLVDKYGSSGADLLLCSMPAPSPPSSLGGSFASSVSGESTLAGVAEERGMATVPFDVAAHQHAARANILGLLAQRSQHGGCSDGSGGGEPVPAVWQVKEPT